MPSAPELSTVLCKRRRVVRWAVVLKNVSKNRPKKKRVLYRGTNRNDSNSTSLGGQASDVPFRADTLSAKASVAATYLMALREGVVQHVKEQLS
jgi:hypothetical protein